MRNFIHGFNEQLPFALSILLMVVLLPVALSSGIAISYKLYGDPRAVHCPGK